MEILTECTLLTADFSQSKPSVMVQMQINGQCRRYAVKVYQNGLLAFDFPDELRFWLRANPSVSHNLMNLLGRLRNNHQMVQLPNNLLVTETLNELQAA